MKLIKFENKDLNESKISKTLNKRKAIIAIIIFLIIIVLIILSAVYITNSNFRNIIDTNIFRKNITENNTSIIEIQKDKNPYFYAYDKYIVRLQENLLTRFSTSGKEEEKIKIEVNNPIFTSSGRNLVIAEKNKQRVYFIQDKQVVWQKDLDGNISRICVNKNGYVSIILSGTAYKSVIVVFDNEGKELFKTYLSNTVAVDSTVSDDNRYMSFAEVNTSGTMIQSVIKTISIEKAKKTPDESIVYTNKGEDDSIVVNIKYQEKNTLTALYNNRIDAIKYDKINTLKRFDNKQDKNAFSDIELDNSIFRVLEKTANFFNSNSTVEIVNTSTSKESTYLLDGIAKNVYANENVIALNLGTEVHFISSNNGWLIKKYNSVKEIQNIVLTNKIAGIIYHDKLELIEL